jgi:hypothetical protein
MYLYLGLLAQAPNAELCGGPGQDADRESQGGAFDLGYGLLGA